MLMLAHDRESSSHDLKGLQILSLIDPFFDPFFDPFPNLFRVLVLSLLLQLTLGHQPKCVEGNKLWCIICGYSYDANTLCWSGCPLGRLAASEPEFYIRTSTVSEKIN